MPNADKVTVSSSYDRSRGNLNGHFQRRCGVSRARRDARYCNARRGSWLDITASGNPGEGERGASISVVSTV